MFLRIFIVFLALVSVLGVGAKLGGWTSADVSSPEVLEAANFAVGAKFPDIRPTFKVTEANKQVWVWLTLFAISGNPSSQILSILITFPRIPNLRFNALSAQVVAGMKYDLTIETTRGNGKCEVDHFQVWNRFGKFTLVEHEVLKQTCKASRV